jgi:hypothetical protein
MADPALQVLPAKAADPDAIDALVPGAELTRDTSVSLSAVSHVVIR